MYRNLFIKLYLFDTVEMVFNNLWDFVGDLEKIGELIRIKEYVNPVLEIPEITDRISKQPDGGKALLFENNGTEFPLLINIFGSDKRMLSILRIKNYDSFQEDFISVLKIFSDLKAGFLNKLKVLPKLNQLNSILPKKINRKGICQEIISLTPDILKFPVLKCWPHDGGKFITLPVVHTHNPTNGIRNVGMYRMQVFSKNETGMHWHRHKGGASHFEEYKKLGKKMPVAVTLGGDPVYTYVATAPLPDNIDEYILAGFIRKKKVRLVKCITQNIYVPEDVDIVIEGYVDPNEDLIEEGPFGDHTGFYSLADKYPKFHITCITHKKNAIYPATIVGIPPQEDYWITKATERLFLPFIKLFIAPDIIDIKLPAEGIAHNLMIAKINKKYPGHANKIMNALWGAGQMSFNKILVIVDEQIDINDSNSLLDYIISNVNPFYDIIISKGPADVLDHASNNHSLGGKMCIDATSKTLEENDKRNLIFNFISSESIYSEINEIPGIDKVYFDFIKKRIPLLLIGVDESIIDSMKSFIQNLVNKLQTRNLYMVLIDKALVFKEINILLWYTLANFDPVRDYYQINQS
ncbi:MAG: menaquinone biosynthesis decarboxylase, partial [Bacteroidales bacterium]|nr:menaquinone biosynthesis decarboxylase [Bacteroidales bacterium]